MKKVILFILFFIVGASMTPQNTPTNTNSTSTVDSTFESRIETLLNNINTDLTKAEEERKAVDKKLELSKLLMQEKNDRFDRIMKKLRADSKLPKPVEEKQVVFVTNKQRYSLKKDSICSKTALFSKRCVKWEPFFVLVDNKLKDTLILKQ